MQLSEYAEKSVRTRKPLGSEQADANHMIIGMFSELNEIQEAILKDDNVQILEELGDFSWYTVGYADIRKIKLQQHIIDWDVEEPKLLEDLVSASSKLSDVVKKFLIYGKEINREEEERLLKEVFHILCNFATVDGSDIYDINDAWRRNINKLQEGAKARYKNGVYTDEAAINRDVDAERKELEK